MSEPLIAGMALADPAQAGAASGLPKHLFDALTLDVRLDASLTGGQRALVAATTLRGPDRALWRERFYRNPLAWELQSRNSARLLARLQRRPDIVLQIHTLFATRGAPYAIYTDWTHALTRSMWRPWSPFSDRQAARWLARERRAYHDAEHLFVMSELVAGSLRDTYAVPPERITVVGSGANFAPLPPVATRGHAPVVLFVGKDWRRKGGEVLLEAFRALRETVPGARLQIVGTTEPREEPGVEVLGRIDDRGHLMRLYAGAAVFCLPSLMEPYANSAVEAMAHGLPVVVSDAGGMPEFVLPNGAGLVVGAGDVEALSAALRRMLLDRELADRCGAAGRRRVERYQNWDRVADDVSAQLRRWWCRRTERCAFARAA
jgi:glycosyltransferase involved in cell wall biosynthesis